ncbi:hypothetical protein LTR53_015139 [Teratosphaeriaceae sp. CCFEE 6253]|nr:hypothetical protein LTR53_015139 [Teratosphaeriaceae sp. CCFEE 6253]
MPHIDMLLSHVVRVDPATLGANLEAYINVHPAIHALRLCNRYGEGKDVHVTRLPAEMISHIESHLVASERDETGYQWNVPSWRFEALCNPVDHYSGEQLVKLRSHHLGENGRGKGRGRQSDLSPHLTCEEREELNRCLTEADEWEEILPGLDCWRVRHDSERIQWGSDDRGFFTTHKAFIRKHFGVDVWISHDIHPEPWHDEDTTLVTLAYLTLPTSAAARNEVFPRIAGLDCTVSLPTETTYALSLSPPPEPTEKSLARFSRAISILGLETWSPGTEPRLVHGLVPTDKADRANGTGDGAGSDATCESEAEPQWLKPCLRLLMAHKDERTLTIG